MTQPLFDSRDWAAHAKTRTVTWVDLPKYDPELPSMCDICHEKTVRGEVAVCNCTRNLPKAMS